jgi:hypothetical protein
MRCKNPSPRGNDATRAISVATAAKKSDRPNFSFEIHGDVVESSLENPAKYAGSILSRYFELQANRQGHPEGAPGSGSEGPGLARKRVNQGIGFGALHYPIDANTMLWGLVIGIAALAICVRL